MTSTNKLRKQLKVRTLDWEHHDGNYPSWRAVEPDVDLDFHIDTGRALIFGKFPLEINQRDSGKKFNTLLQAQRYAQKYFEDLVWAIFDDVFEGPSHDEHAHKRPPGTTCPCLC